MLGRSRANEIPELIRRLGSRDRARAEAAGARLSVIGERAVEDLIEALEGDDRRVRARVMPLLALIQDSRAREPLTAMLLDRNAGLRAIAARGLARFPCPNSVRALNRLFEREKAESVKIAAVHSLVESYEGGCEDALGQLLRLLGFPHQSPRVRLAAMSVLRVLPASQRRGILARLQQDAEPVVRDKARELASSLHEASTPASTEIDQVLTDLGSTDYAQWNEAVRRLGAIGGPAVRPLVAEMRRRASDPEYCTRAGMALKSLGPRRARGLADALDDVAEPLPLQVLVEVIGALGEKSMIYRLAEVIERTAPGDSETAPAEDDLAPLERVRAKAHLELARVGSRVAVRDLCRALAGRRIEPELLAAVELVGKREELPLLVRAFERGDDFIRRRIARAVREIMKRERIRRNSKALQHLSEEQRAALARILAHTRGAPRRGEFPSP